MLKLFAIRSSEGYIYLAQLDCKFVIKV